MSTIEVFVKEVGPISRPPHLLKPIPLKVKAIPGRTMAILGYSTISLVTGYQFGPPPLLRVRIAS